MTPEALAFIGSLLDRYGLPLTLGIGLAWALLTRRLTLGSETDYIEERRAEERKGRLEAEAAARDMTKAVGKLGDSIEELTDRLLESLGDTTENRRVPRR